MSIFELSFENFRNRNVNIIKAFDWIHILREEYLPLCVKALKYDESSFEEQKKIISMQEIEKVRELDDFLEYFENMYFAYSRRLVEIDDLLVFYRSFLKQLCDEYRNPNDQRLKNYIDNYFYNIQELLDISTKKNFGIKTKLRGRIHYLSDQHG